MHPSTDRRPEAGVSSRRSDAAFRRRVMTALLMGAAVVLSIHLVFNVASVLLLLFISLLLAVALRSLTNWLRNHLPLGDKAAFALALLFNVVLFAGFFYLIFPTAAEQIDALAEQLPASVEAIESELRRHSLGRQVLDELPDSLSISDLDRMIDGNLVGRITGVFSDVADAVGQFIIVLFTAIFLAADPSSYFENGLRLFPRSSRARLRRAGAASFNMLQMWLLSRVASALVTGPLVYIGLTLLDMPFVLTLALIAAVLSFVPTFGPIIALVPALLVALLQSPQTALYVLGIYLGAEFIDNYIVSPILHRAMLTLPPAFVIVSQVILGVLAGKLGLLLAAPLVAAIVPLVRILYVEGVVEREESPTTSVL